MWTSVDKTLSAKLRVSHIPLYEPVAHLKPMPVPEDRAQLLLTAFLLRRMSSQV